MALPLEQSNSPLHSANAFTQSLSRELTTTLNIAARSILDCQASRGTVANVVADRVLDHYWQGLFQYAAIRTDRDRSSALLERLEREFEGWSRDDIEQMPGARAGLYRRVRELLAEDSGGSLALGADSSLWWCPREPAFQSALVELRRSLSPQHRELVELRFARRLTPAEVAYVVAQSEAEVEAGLSAAVAYAARLFGERPPSHDHTLEGALLEAFALDANHAHVPRRRLRHPVLRIGALIGDRYEIEARLGSGAFADVYSARDREVTDHVVALKILRTPAADARSVRTALRELQLIASVFHPSVVQLKDHGWHDGHLWFVMPLYRGETLATRLTRGALSRREAREIFEPLAEALATMHRAGVRHQDIKPDNVFLADIDPDATSPEDKRRVLPVLLDLGVAAKDAELVLAGTPAYLAPEVAARFAGAPDPAPVGPKADVFSLALTLCQAIDPACFEGVAAGAVDAFVAFRGMHSPNMPTRRELSDLKPAFARWLNFSPDQRPTADELRRELALLTAPEERAARRRALVRAVAPITVAALALFAAVVFVLSREASLQRLEATHARERAEQAREEAASVYASLTVQEARRRELEADVARLEQEYQTSRLTREELASRLAQSEGQLAVLAERQSAQAQRLHQETEEARTLREERAELHAALKASDLRRQELKEERERIALQLEGERGRRLEAESIAGQLREQVRTAHQQAEQHRARLGDLESRVGALREALTGSSSRRPTRHYREQAL